MKKLLSACAAALAIVLVACDGHTTGTNNIGETTATINAEGHCEQSPGYPPDKGFIYWQYRQVGTTPWTRVNHSAMGPCTTRTPASGEYAFYKNLTGLTPNTNYEYRVCLDWDDAQFPGVTDTCADSAGYNGTNYHSFTTDSAPTGFTPGVVANADHAKSNRVANNVGADLIRFEFDINTEVSVPGAGRTAMDNTIGAAANNGARALLLAGFHARQPTVAEAQNLADWANRYGPGGDFWAGRSDGHLAVQEIEFGNETSFCYQYNYAGCAGAWYNSLVYQQAAELYASRAQTAINAINATDNDLDVLVQADNGGSGASTWVDNMYDAVPNLHSIVGGWTVHPYGPQVRWQDKLDKVVSQTAANGAPNTIPIDITEYGLSTDNGRVLTDNYGWPVNQTYAQAAVALDSAVDGILARYGSRISDFMVYSTYDFQPSGQGTNNRENWFGVQRSNETDKGAYTVQVRDLFN